MLLSEVNCSVIISYYNRPKEVHDLIRSVIRSFGICGRSDFEILIICDGSKIELEIENEKIKVISLDKNYGRPAIARNFGMDLARGNLLFFSDDDDLWHDYKVTKYLERFESNEKIDMICSNGYFFNSAVQTVTLRDVHTVFRKQGFLHLIDKNPVIFSSLAVRKDSIKGLRFNESERFKAFEDFEFIKSAIKNGCSLYYLKDALIYYRIGNEKLTQNFNKFDEYKLFKKRQGQTSNVAIKIQFIKGIVRSTLGPIRLFIHRLITGN